MVDNTPQIPKAVHTLMQKFLGVDPALILAGLQESLQNMQRFCIHFDNRQTAIEQQLAALTDEIRKLNEHFEHKPRLEPIPDDALSLIKVAANGKDAERIQANSANGTG